MTTPLTMTVTIEYDREIEMLNQMNSWLDKFSKEEALRMLGYLQERQINRHIGDTVC